MQSLIQVIMQRDGVSETEVLADIEACREEMLEAIDSGDFTYAEELFTDWFGLEPDYIMEAL